MSTGFCVMYSWAFIIHANDKCPIDCTDQKASVLIMTCTCNIHQQQRYQYFHHFRKHTLPITDSFASPKNVRQACCHEGVTLLISPLYITITSPPDMNMFFGDAQCEHFFGDANCRHFSKVENYVCIVCINMF